MDNLKLSSDSDLLICEIYKLYLIQRSQGRSKVDAKYIGSYIELANLIPNSTYDDINDTCRILGKLGLLSISYADNACNHISLTEDGIVYMENRFYNKISNVIEYITK